MALDPQELRIALVLNGGVSLAIWMGGAVRELDRRRSATGAYAELLALTRSTARIDVIAGASAGGINGAVLALAMTRGGTVEPVRDLWMTDGAIEHLLRDPFEKDALSLLKGDDHLLVQLHSAMHVIGQPGADPVDHPVHLSITGTTLVGEVKGYADRYGAVIPDVDHRALFTFRHSAGEVDWGTDDFARDADDTAASQLALAARSTASFPGAFEPSFVPVDETVDALHPDMAGIADFSATRWVIDGGVLVNTPFRAALDAIAALPADRPVRRVLGYVMPNPVAPAPGEPDQREDTHSAIDVALDALSTLPRAQSVGRELEEIEANNNDVRRRRLAREETLTALTPETLKSAAWALLTAYVRTRKETAADEITALILEGVKGPTPALAIDVRSRLLALEDAPWIPVLGDGVQGWDEIPIDPWRWGFAPLQNAANVVLHLLRRAADRVDPPLYGHLREATHEQLKELRRLQVEKQAAWRTQDPSELVPPWTDELSDELLEIARRLARILFDVWMQIPSGHPVSPMLRTLLDDGVTESASHDTTVRRLLALDVVQRTTGADLRGIEQAVDLVLMSSDVPTVIDEGARTTAEEKLAGPQVNRFGGFYKQSWRANDYMWGRLDGADRLVRLLLDPKRIRARLDEETLATDEDTAIDAIAAEIHAIAVPSARPYLVGKWNGEAVKAELAALGEEPLASALPETHKAITRRVQLDILGEEIPNVRASVAADGVKGASKQALGVQWAAGLPPAPLVDEQLVAALQSCNVGQEKLADEYGSDHFTKVVTRAGGVAGSVLGGAIQWKPARPLIAWIRGLFLTIYLLARGVLESSRTGSFLVAAVLATGGAFVALTLIGINVPGLLTLLGVMLLIAGVALAVIQDNGPRALNAILVIAAAIVAFVGIRAWDGRPDALDAAAEVCAFAVLVLVPAWLGTKKQGD